jgi:hypothetical protein
MFDLLSMFPSLAKNNDDTRNLSFRLQLGIQCKWCKHRNYSDRQERAVCFPSTIKNIYHSIETWQRRHSTVCGDIPPWAKTQMTNLMKCSRSGAGGRRLYWEESAKRLGMVDTDNGVRFFRPPGTIDPPPIKNTLPLQQLSVTMTPNDNGSVEICMDIDGNNTLGHNQVITIDTTVSHAIVREDDLELQITGYLFCLLEQMESCYFSDEDRIGGRSKVKSCQSGYPGYVFFETLLEVSLRYTLTRRYFFYICYRIQCKHCGGKSGFGRYFPASCAALSSANSDRNIFNHISKCRKCPEEVRDRLTSLFKQQSTFKNRRGTRKIFFERIWARMHQQEEPDLPTMRKSSKHEAIPEELPSPMQTVRENDTASAPVWQEPPPPPPPAPRPKPVVPPPRPQHRPIPQPQQPQYQVQPPHQQVQQQHQIPHQQQQLPQHHVQQQHRPEDLVPLQQQQQHRPQDLVPLQSPQVFQEVPQQPSIVQHVPRRVDQDMILQPMTMMMVPIQDLPLMHQQQALVHEQRIHQQLQLRNMQQQQLQQQQHHHPSLVVLQQQQQQMQAPHHHQQQHHQGMVQQQHAMQQQQHHHFQRQQQPPLQQHHHLMVQRPTAQRAYLPHSNMQFAAMLDQQPSQVATSSVPYLHHQHHPYATNNNTNMQPPVAAATLPYSTYQPARQQFRLPSDGTTTNISAV